jgi:dehydrogenase/reductase SDR family protein 1
MAVDCGIELKKHNIAVLSLWLGGVSTEAFVDFSSKKNDDEVFLENMFGKVIKMKDYKEMQKLSESVEFSGKVIVHLAQNKNIMSLTSKIIIAEDYAQKYNLKDIDNRVIPSLRQINAALEVTLPKPLKFLAYLVPNFVKIPIFMIELFTSRF